MPASVLVPSLTLRKAIGITRPPLFVGKKRQIHSQDVTHISINHQKTFAAIIIDDLLYVYVFSHGKPHKDIQAGVHLDTVEKHHQVKVARESGVRSSTKFSSCSRKHHPVSRKAPFHRVESHRRFSRRREYSELDASCNCHWLIFMFFCSAFIW